MKTEKQNETEKLKIERKGTKSNQFPYEEENRSQDGRKKNLLD